MTTYNLQNMYLNLLIKIIITRYFAKNRCLFIINDDFNGVNIDGNIPIVNLKVNGDQFDYDAFGKSFGCTGFVLRTNEVCKVFKKIETMVKHSNNRFNTRKYLILPPSEDGYDYNEQIQCMYQLGEIDYVNNILIVTSKTSIIEDDSYKFLEFSNEISFDLHTHKYVGKHHNDTILLDRWFAINQTFLYNNNLYLDKLSDQEGRSLRMATFTYPPYSIPEIGSGVELNMAKLYAEIHNMTPELILDESNQWGIINDNWTGTGLTGNIVMDRADLGFAAYYAFIREYSFMDYSQTFSRSGITCIVPAPRLSAGWLTPIAAFSSELWIALIITLFLVTISFFLITLIIEWCKLQNNTRRNDVPSLITDATLNTLSIYLMQSVTKHKIIKCKLFKFVFGMNLLICVILTSSYGSGLASNMTIPKYVGEIKTIKDFAESNLHWGATTFLWLSNVVNDTDVDRSTVYKRFEVMSKEELYKKTKKNNFGFIVERLPGGHYALPDYIRAPEVYKLTTMKEDLFYEQCIFMLRKSSILLQSFNDLLMKIFEAGIIYYWETKVVMETMEVKLQRALMNSNRHKEAHGDIKKIQINHLAGAFGVLALGLLSSFIIFLLEYFGHRL